MEKTKQSFHSKLIVFVGLFVLIFGYILMYKMLVAQGFLLSWEMIQAVFLWVVVVIFLIVLSIVENIKEEIRLEIQTIKAELSNKKKK